MTYALLYMGLREQRTFEWELTVFLYGATGSYRLVERESYREQHTFVLELHTLAWSCTFCMGGLQLVTDFYMVLCNLVWS